MSASNNGFNARVFLQQLTNHPGIYQFFSAQQELLYVGKAANLKKRVQSYFRNTGLTIKTESLMRQVAHVEVIVTQSETEALILENNLIKQHHPKYNILLRDDKSYPYIFVSDERYPRLKLYRGTRSRKGRYFGPYPSALAAKEAIDLLQKTFLIRNCENSFFNHRSRPCLQYQIGRCTAPCVDYVSAEEYQAQMAQVVRFLEGKNADLLDELADKMQQAAQVLDFERAAQLRDQQQNLRKALEKQYISTDVRNDVDVMVCLHSQNECVLQVFYYRQGHNLGNQVFYPSIGQGDGTADILQAFLEQFYLDKPPPSEIVLNQLPSQVDLLQRFFGERYQKTVTFSTTPTGGQGRIKSQWLVLAERNTDISLQNKLQRQDKLSLQWSALQKLLKITDLQEMACIDISHTMGEATVASWVVFDAQGAKKSAYRKYNIENIIPGDDYAAMQQALQRRFKPQSRTATGQNSPDIVFIDGGLGQCRMAEQVLRTQNLLANVQLVGIAKGVERKAGKETLLIFDKTDNAESLTYQSQNLPENHPALHLIQQIRDEAHRFALLGHRKKRDKTRLQSELEMIDGIGDKRRQMLLRHFGGIKGVKAASVESLMQVKGIHAELAKSIFGFFHD